MINPDSKHEHEHKILSLIRQYIRNIISSIIQRKNNYLQCKEFGLTDDEISICRKIYGKYMNNTDIEDYKKYLESQKKPTNEEMESILKKLKTLEQIDTNDSNKYPEEKFFGSNFYLLFKALMHKGKTENIKLNMCLKKAEELGEKWEHFLKDNSDLLDQLYEIISQHEIYKEAENLSLRLYKHNREDKSSDDFFKKNIHPELGITAIYIPIYKKLNPLLKQAAEKMEKVGINYKDFEK
jgi:hypothetical protein